VLQGKNVDLEIPKKNFGEDLETVGKIFSKAGAKKSKIAFKDD
jgi:hypothetical protein